jgi:hypothetical protein
MYSGRNSPMFGGMYCLYLQSQSVSEAANIVNDLLLLVHSAYSACLLACLLSALFNPGEEVACMFFHNVNVCLLLLNEHSYSQVIFDRKLILPRSVLASLAQALPLSGWVVGVIAKHEGIVMCQ